jgi:hypothetical protein
MGDRGFPLLQLSRFSTSVVMRLCNIFCNPFCVLNLEMRFILRGRVVTPQGLNMCNLALIMDVIKGSNQVCKNSIKFYQNSKFNAIFQFSVEFCWPLVKVSNTKLHQILQSTARKIPIFF